MRDGEEEREGQTEKVQNDKPLGPVTRLSGPLQHPVRSWHVFSMAVLSMNITKRAAEVSQRARNALTCPDAAPHTVPSWHS